MGRVVDGWFNGANTGHATLILLGLYVAAWTAFQIISHASLDLHEDSLEMFVWGQHLAAGNPKHPPLGALMSAAWFSLFPQADWAFYLLAVLNSAIALLAVDLIARRYLSGDKRLLALLLLLLLPFYQFTAGKWGANQTLLSTWPVATYCFLRAFETRALIWSAAVGLAAAAATLGKYYSIYLIGGFMAAVLLHPSRWTYFKSYSPWISAGCAWLVLAPHAHWLMTNGFMPFEYAYAVHGSSVLGRVLAKVAVYLIEGLGYAMMPIAVYLLALRPDLATLRCALWPPTPDRRMLVVMLLAFLLLPAISAPFLRVVLTPVWTMQSWFLLPVVLLAPERIVLHRRVARHVAILVALTTGAALIAAPAVAWYYHRYNPLNERAYYRATSDGVTEAWHQTIGSQLRYVAGLPTFAAAAAFYSPDRPTAVPGFTPRTTGRVRVAELDQYGFALACLAADPFCAAAMAEQGAKHPLARSIAIPVHNSYLGDVSASQQLLILLVPPKAAPAFDQSGDTQHDGARGT